MPKKKNEKKVTEVLEVPLPSKAKLVINEAVYQAALKNPWDAPDNVRIPDKDATETATLSGKGNASIGVITGSGSGYASGMIVFPYCGDSGATPKVYYVSSMVSVTSCTWSTYSNSYGVEESVLASESDRLRTVCMGVEFRIEGVQDTLEGRYFVGWIRKEDLDEGYANSLSDLANSKDIHEYSVAEMQKGVRVTWKPGSYNVYQTSTAMNVPAACWHDQTLAMASWDNGEILPIAFSLNSSASGTPYLVCNYITRYEYMPVSADYQTTPTEAALGSGEVRSELGMGGPVRGTGKSLKKIALNGLKAALKNERVNSLLAKGTKAILPGWANKAISATPKPISQILTKIPVIGGYFGKLFGLMARRMLVALRLRPTPQNVQLLAEALKKYNDTTDMKVIMHTLTEIHSYHDATGTFRCSF